MTTVFGFMATILVLCIPQTAHSEPQLEIAMNFKPTNETTWEVIEGQYVTIRTYKLAIETPLGTEEWLSTVINTVNPNFRILVSAPTLEALKQIIQAAVNDESTDLENQDILIIRENTTTGSFFGKGSYDPGAFFARLEFNLSGNTKTKKLYSDVDDDNIDDYKFKLTITGLDPSIQTLRRAPAARLGGGLIAPQEGGL
jgi:hypothetical protein